MNQPNPSPNALHPIARLAATLIVEKNGAPELSAASVSQLEDELAKLFDDPGLRSAVEELVNLSMHLEMDRKAPEAARAILRIATLAAPMIQKRADAQNDAAARQARETQRMFFGDEAAQRFVAPAPAAVDGGVRIADLMPRKKIR